MNSFSDIIKKTLAKSSFNLSEAQLNKFISYALMLVEWNKKFNLTSITEPKEIAIKHFIDSLTLLEVFDVQKDAKIIDVGTGAGFPGVPLKIVRPDINLTLLDSLNKRLLFLENLCTKLNISTQIIHSRAEDAAKLSDFREKFDIAISRAVAPLNILLEYCIPFVKINGFLIAFKGKNAINEVEASNAAQKALKVELISIKSCTLPNSDLRNLIILKKAEQTPPLYPRSYAKISKKPL